MAKYEFIDSHKDYQHPLSTIMNMCAWIKVSRSRYYRLRSRPQSGTAARREELTARIWWYFDNSDQTYSYRRIHAELVVQALDNVAAKISVQPDTRFHSDKVVK